MQRVIHIDGREILVDISADTPRQYREEFGRDLIVDITAMGKQLDTAVLENLAFTMAKAADPELAGVTIHEWLRGFDSVTAIYNAAPEILEAWTKNTEQSSESKKK